MKQKSINISNALMNMVQVILVIKALHLNYTGVEHNIEFVYCSCEPVTVTLARAEMWPATPCNPGYAFSFALLDWVEALLLECQVSLRDVCSALKFRCPSKVYHIKNNE